ncbi:hypothetical protein TPHA_0D03650 [Tetrapisispora phaffii CBS 4417]|uniref:Autophagy-related protein 3 n=1 Tax=Tetrapisispora phaffii (strain ATCC 24235 / CBS 4417 / NBRC 1672 / NRRL Y-8282 / UCD 70-5) TaxID=1071381 RepID=G8BT29_TETPH|nr:hypothetical protein TPHA_0D03650 [Tetrapisispora phaffii CBS 4417]CCE63000.1 hypothetical protein TPHA_0D03650 [Tetrapisispora phaffii CBS 4417]
MLRSTIRNWREYLTPVSHKSTFLNTGEITPEEFIQAGDYLCHMFPIWSWNEATKDISNRSFLPEDKQFLVVRKVPSSQRAQTFTSFKDDDKVADKSHIYYEEGLSNKEGEEGEEEEGWLVSDEVNNVVNVTRHSLEDKKDQNSRPTASNDIDAMMESMGLEDLTDDDDLIDNGMDRTNMRYYDLYITYSSSYKVPKMYLVGFSSNGSPLIANEMFEDITPDYRAKTATIEKLPFYKNSIASVSIHPCKHANVMRVLLEKVASVKQKKAEEDAKVEKKHDCGGESESNQDDWEDVQIDMSNTIRVDMYLVVFLKFITSVTPGIEHDYTMEGW